MTASTAKPTPDPDLAPETLETTADSLFGGAVSLFQPARGHGYRANVDGVLLAAFALQTRAEARLAVDLGAGVGTIGFALAHLGRIDRLVFIERRSELAHLATRNVSTNGLAERATVVVADLAEGVKRVAPDLLHRADLVVANPPYVAPGRDGHAPGQGFVAHKPRKTSRDPARLDARRGDLDPFVRAAVELLGRRGHAFFVYPAHAIVELVESAQRARLFAKRLRFVHGTPSRPARVALVELACGRPGGLVVLAPLIETDGKGTSSPEVAALLVAPRAAQTVEHNRARGPHAEVIVSAGSDPAHGLEKGVG